MTTDIEKAPTAVIGQDIRERLEQVESEIAEIESRLPALQAERKVLGRSLADIEKLFGSNGDGASASAEVGYEQIVDALRGQTAAISTKGLASALGTEPRRIARKLLKLAQEGRIQGDKNAGWSTAAQ